MLKNVLLIILFIFLGILVWYRTPISSEYYYSQANKLYNMQKYEEASIAFEKILSVNPKNSSARTMYTLSLSKLDPVYSVQKKLYEISESDVNDQNKDFAKNQVIQIKRKLLEGLEDNYIYNALNGKEVLRWDINKFPLKIYYEQASGLPSYYRENIQKAFEQWSKRAQFLKFEEVSSQEDANIVIYFKDFTSKDCNSSNGCAYVVAYTDPIIKGENILVRMDLIFYKNSPSGNYFSELEVYNTALHEIGHTLGIMGHSDNPSDVMYSNGGRVNDLYMAYRSESQFISMRDLKTLILLYKLAPTVSNTKGLFSENMYYAPLILGNNNELLENKLTELEKYIQVYPNLAAGYINIAALYVDLGDPDKAFKYLDIGESYASNQDEKYLIEYNRAIIYYNRQQFSDAMLHAKKAYEIKSSSQAQELIHDIEVIMSNR